MLRCHLRTVDDVTADRSEYKKKSETTRKYAPFENEVDLFEVLSAFWPQMQREFLFKAPHSRHSHSLFNSIINLI